MEPNKIFSQAADVKPAKPKKVFFFFFRLKNRNWSEQNWSFLNLKKAFLGFAVFTSAAYENFFFVGLHKFLIVFREFLNVGGMSQTKPHVCTTRESIFN